MPSPSTSLATLRPDLAASFMEFDLAMNRQNFIAQRVMPVIEVAKPTGTFGRIPIEQLLKDRATARAPGAGYSRSSFTFTTDSYTCVEHGAEEVVDDNEASMYSEYFDAEQIAAARALSAVMLNYEKRVAAAIFDTTTWTGSALTTAVGVKWNVPATATPIADIEAAVQKVYDASGLWPNALIINRKVFRNLRNVDEIINRIKYAGFTDPRSGTINEAALGQVFDLDQIVVAGGTKDTAAEGQTSALAPIWSDTMAMVCRLTATQDIREPGLGRTFHWGEDGSTVGGTMESYRQESVRGDVIRVRHQTDEKVLYVEAGHLLTAVT
ncbi:MAG: hypothetical protein ACE5E6_09430 [Phycisphaerae bacterium]